MNGVRLLLVAAVIAGLSYPLGWTLGLPAAANLAWKGAGVGLLALWAATQARSLDGWLLVVVLAFGALGDVLLERDMVLGATAFVAGHCVAIRLYWRNRRPALTVSQRTLALLTVPVAVLVAFLLPADRTAATTAAAYTLFVAVMAACAWASRFPRYRTGIGAMLFLASDLLIFARMGPLSGGGGALGLAIWLSYFVGQTLIAVGVRSTLDRRAGT
ncbi:lysoplasmalogenase family protein [Sphingomonas flavalba]|uniref:lysoplasmalogenase family protein n=1 Tax=Sphingomonas flavalba TaxID=2559804 RepID=UPI00109E15F2|nr:lysoplasmalogenase family protein [Sphingomonas flavalba]